MNVSGIHLFKKWLLPLGLGVLLLAIFLAKAVFLSASPNDFWTLPSPAISGLLFYLGGMALYFWLFPRAGLIPLLAFHFLVGIVFILGFDTPIHPDLAYLQLLAFTFTPPTFFNFSPLISETLIEVRRRAWLFGLPYLLSGVIGILCVYFFHSHPETWKRLYLFLLAYLFVAYGYWIIRLIEILRKPRILLDQWGARYLLIAQLLIFLAPILFFLALYLWKGFPFLSPEILLFPLALFLGIYPGKRRQMETYIVQSEKRKSFGPLLAGLTHEINNPLNFIYSNMEPMKEMVHKLKTHLSVSDEAGLRILEDLEKMAGSMEDGVQTIRGLIEQFRGFPKPRPEEKERVDLNQVIDRSIELLAHKWKNKIEVERRFGEIPAVRGFAAELQQVFTNLIANACDSTPAGGSVEISTQSAVGGVNIFVKDSGAGIPKENISKIFDPFFTTKAQGEGTGLGLPIAQQIIKSHKGSIEVQSEPGRGTEFLVFLPS